MRASFIEPVGAWDRYDTITGFRITPIVGLIEPDFSLTLDPREVASVFEAPLSFLFDPANHERRAGIWRGAERHYYAMPYEGRFIWGATAGMIRALYERLYVVSAREPTRTLASLAGGRCRGEACSPSC